ncbi:MAG: GNAT family N-acetyltransferase [Microthrixaceae bacterium]
MGQARKRWQTLRSFSAWDGDACVGHVGGFGVDTTVPGGGQVPTMAVTSAGVLPTHVGRGIFRRLMDALHGDARADGVVMASLRASESTIYERFGYGLAGEAVTATVDAARATPLHGADLGGSFELLAPADLHATVRPIYERATGRPGHISRPDWIWERYFENVAGHTVENVVVHRAADGTADGYAHYELKWAEDIFGDDHGTGTVHEVWATDPSVEVALWQFLLTIPLVKRLSIDELATDSVLFRAVARLPRRACVDEVGRTMGAPARRRRRTGGPIVDRRAPVVIDVEGVGRWRIGDAGVEQSTDDADLTTDIAGISAAYLGSTGWWS